jgi:hypothetical protein
MNLTMKSTKSKLNVKLLRRIQQHILEEPRRLDMGNWKSTRTDGPCAPPCGTVACIAGWALVLSGKSIPEFENIAHDAAELIGVQHTQSGDVNVDEDCQAGKLFLRFEWPEPFVSQFADATDISQRAQITANRIEHLITTGE